MTKTTPNARMRMNAHRKPRYSLAYSASKSEYKILYYYHFWPALRLWWQLKRHPAYTNVRLEVE